MSKILEVNDLSFTYERQPILTDVSFVVEQGEFVGLIGPNGGGKTTLLKLILGFLRPTAGSLSLFGLSPKEARAKIAYVPQNLRYDRDFPLTVLELVLGGKLSETPWYHGKKFKSEALEVLDRVGLADKAYLPFPSLSGGQAQRALIARALVSDPEFLLLDEPTANVDAKAEQEIHHLLHDLKGTITMMMVTHNYEVATHLVDRVLCVQNHVDALVHEQVCEHFAMGIYHAPLNPEES